MCGLRRRNARLFVFDAHPLQIRSLEDQNLEDKHWALKGEVSKADRPESSLLESYLDFDHVAQAAPLLTEQHTAKVEALIKRRVLEVCALCAGGLRG